MMGNYGPEDLSCSCAQMCGPMICHISCFTKFIRVEIDTEVGGVKNNQFGAIPTPNMMSKDSNILCTSFVVFFRGNIP